MMTPAEAFSLMLWPYAIQNCCLVSDFHAELKRLLTGGQGHVCQGNLTVLADLLIDGCYFEKIKAQGAIAAFEQQELLLILFHLNLLYRMIVFLPYWLVIT